MYQSPIKLFFLSLLTILLVSTFSHASSEDEWKNFDSLEEYSKFFEDKYGRKLEFDEFLKASDQIRQTYPERVRLSDIYTDHGYNHPGTEIVKKVADLEKQSGNLFDDLKVIELTRFMVEAEGQTWKKRSSCFTCSMKVLTTQGYIAIGDIAIGDKVLSWDFTNNKLVESEVLEINEAKNIEYGMLESSIYRNGKLEVTSDHPLYSLDAGDYRPVDSMNPSSPLMGVRGNPGTPALCKRVFGPRGTFKPLGRTKVRSLTLKGKLKNYFVEGVLVRNKPTPKK